VAATKLLKADQRAIGRTKGMFLIAAARCPVCFARPLFTSAICRDNVEPPVRPLSPLNPTLSGKGRGSPKFPRARALLLIQRY